jgi:hypothetical protein
MPSKPKTLKNDELKMATQPHKELRWDLMALVASDKKEDQEQIQIALESGYEPFSVTPHVLPPENSLLSPNQMPQPKMANLIWFKRGVYVEIKENV